MESSTPPRLRKFPAVKQRRLDELLEKNSEGTITPAEKARLEELVDEAERTTGEDRAGRPQPLFNPRAYDPWLLGWHLHFVLDRESGMILPRSAVGEATVAALNMNGRHRRFARLLQIRAGLIG